MNISFHAVTTSEEVRSIFPLMQQLRPHLLNADELVERWQRQTQDSYRIVALYDAEQPCALAGYRVQENLVYGRFLYLDDLVSDVNARSKGYGAMLIAYVREQASELACSKLVLDTALSNSIAQRFYYRCGLLATSMRFNTPIQC
ncbi:GNAT family N-acetyltransferase [Undibacterium sp. TJN19]|uniref:GNAT family N-acetyltransferase n=1 Tax=Undibacterium sp. TJN19 TaxID=3413055 RepID=UPI003BEFAE64